MSESAAAPPLDALASLYEEYKYGLGKHFSIVRSSSAIVSVAASILLVWILFRSRSGINNTYHRLLLGLSISDIFLSLGLATFGAAAPSELSYAVWNARGNRASCDAFGFMTALGTYSGLIYMCSLNLYYLAKVKFNKTDSYVAKKLEPWLHVVPTLYGLIVSIVLLAKQRMNASIDGLCSAITTYEPPHCSGHEDGDTAEGFEIPCGRGRRSELIITITRLITVFLVPITIGGSLCTIYRAVLNAEQRISRYGAGALHPNRSQPMTDDAAATNTEGGGSGFRGTFSVLSSFSTRFGGWASRTSSSNQDSSQSRAVLHRAAAYSVAYFVTWMWVIIYGVLNLAGAWSKSPLPTWQIAYRYVWLFFAPLQGLWTFLIYMQPSVVKRKQSSGGNISWFRAFADTLGLAVTGGNYSAKRPGLEGRNTSPTARSTDHQGVCRTAEAVGLEVEDAQEEKREIQEYEPSM